jgi:hypothetical protein
MKWGIVKKVYGCKYYWNNKKRQWEGLLDNATEFYYLAELKREIGFLGEGEWERVIKKEPTANRPS